MPQKSKSIATIEDACIPESLEAIRQSYGFIDRSQVNLSSIKSLMCKSMSESALIIDYDAIITSIIGDNMQIVDKKLFCNLLVAAASMKQFDENESISHCAQCLNEENCEDALSSLSIDEATATIEKLAFIAVYAIILEARSSIGKLTVYNTTQSSTILGNCTWSTFLRYTKVYRNIFAVAGPNTDVQVIAAKMTEVLGGYYTLHSITDDITENEAILFFKENSIASIATDKINIRGGLYIDTTQWKDVDLHILKLFYYLSRPYNEINSPSVAKGIFREILALESDPNICEIDDELRHIISTRISAYEFLSAYFTFIAAKHNARDDVKSTFATYNYGDYIIQIKHAAA